MKYSISFIVFVLLGVFAFKTGAQQDLSQLIASLQAQIKALQQQIASLQANTPPSEIPPFMSTLHIGVRGPEVENLQKFLKTFPSIYPEGLVTGYFGPLTQQAVMKFQEQHGIETVGIVGPITRARLNEMRTLPAPAPTPTPPPPPPTTPPPAPTPTPPPPPPSSTGSGQATGPIPTPGQLGMPLPSFFGWGQTDAIFHFTHETGTYTRSYTIYIKEPNGIEVAYGPYALPNQGGETTLSDGSKLKRLGPVSFEWRKPIATSTPSGTYIASAEAIGEANVKGTHSPGFSAILYPQIEFESLLQGTPLRDVINNEVNHFPLTMRIKNPVQGLYYRYFIYQGDMLIWESAYTRQSDSSKIEVVYTGGNYYFTMGSKYTIRIEAFDNNTAGNSAIKQMANELTFTYKQPY